MVPFYCEGTLLATPFFAREQAHASVDHKMPEYDMFPLILLGIEW
jgi:hypothetical protein